ncbi:hypothetical protein TIFTF001_053744 [Ficus carica]|uniref:Uncharacterized protein n=1 Tax=Ficus carica TaxID=3494 RepID=A0AA88EFB8_FICCA|nr:hypothetical protein TIFTF001_053744 [Ficus carica]
MPPANQRFDRQGPASASFLAYPVVDSSIARRQPWPLSPPPARRRSKKNFFFSSPTSHTLACKEINIPSLNGSYCFGHKEING